MYQYIFQQDSRNISRILELTEIYLMLDARKSRQTPDLTPKPQFSLNDLRRRWGKFDESELAAIGDSADLVVQIQAKYGLDREQAQTRFDLWAKGR
jgi:hypothetical protein